jgi:uncharacterized protein (DUF2235 family)
LSTNVKDAYRFLLTHYEPGDELFLFGFSRGAYTVRSVAGFIRNCGLLRRKHANRLEDAYALYRRRDADSNPRAIEAELFRKSFTYEAFDHEVRMKFIGVWDTVGALGIPIGYVGKVSRTLLRLQFHDVKLSSYVDNAFHALAIDERRAPFTPTKWDQQPHAHRQRLEQVWFAGVHSNVGGGYEDPGLSDVALLWMTDAASQCGLTVDEDYFRTQVHADPLGELRDSRTGFYRLFREYVRPVSNAGVAPAHETIHPTVQKRLARDPLYRPPNLRRELNSSQPRDR